MRAPIKYESLENIAAVSCKELRKDGRCLTCWVALASSEFWSNSRNNPTEKGYESRMDLTTSIAGGVFSPNNMLPKSMQSESR